MQYGSYSVLKVMVLMPIVTLSYNVISIMCAEQVDSVDDIKVEAI